MKHMVERLREGGGNRFHNDAQQRVAQQSVFRKVAGGDTMQEKLDRLPPAPALPQAGENVAERSTVQDRIKQWEQRAQKRH